MAFKRKFERLGKRASRHVPEVCFGNIMYVLVLLALPQYMPGSAGMRFLFSAFLKNLDRKKSTRRGCGKRAFQRFPGVARDCGTPVGNPLLVFHGLSMVEQPRRDRPRLAFSAMRPEPITVQSLYNHCTISVRYRAFLYREVLFFVPRSSVFCTEKFCGKLGFAQRFAQ